MNTETTRRAFLTAIPLSAAAVTIPGIAAAHPATSPEWERTKRRFTDAVARFDAACDAGCRIDREKVDFNKTAPEREVTYTQEGWRIENANGVIELKGRNGAFVLDRRNYNGPGIERGLKATPEYAAFCAEMEAWEQRRTAYGEARGWQAVENEWESACDAREEAWRALVRYPVESIPQVAEKLTLARSVDILDDSEAAQLMDAIGADFARLLPPGR